MNPRHTAIAQTSTVILSASLVGVLAKLALRDVPAFTFVWLQIAIGGILLTLFTFLLRGAFRKASGARCGSTSS